MRVLVACEYSGRVRDAFIRAGHEAMSCDLLPTDEPGPHYQGDVRDVIGDGWDLMIAHPPCTHLAVSGARWFKDKQTEQTEALEFVRMLMDAPIERIAIENPISIISSRIRKPDQVIQPWQYGHGETKATCLWLKGLPKLTPTNIVEGREARVHKMPPGPNRWKERSRTFEGLAAAMAAQWGQAHNACKGKNCGCTDGVSHSAECQQEHQDSIDGVLGRCSVPMWMGGCPAGTCGEKAYGHRPPSREWMNHAAGQMMREDLRYNGYVPGLACPKHGGPEAPNAELRGAPGEKDEM